MIHQSKEKLLLRSGSVAFELHLHFPRCLCALPLPRALSHSVPPFFTLSISIVPLKAADLQPSIERSPQPTSSEAVVCNYNQLLRAAESRALSTFLPRTKPRLWEPPGLGNPQALLRGYPQGGSHTMVVEVKREQHSYLAFRDTKRMGCFSLPPPLLFPLNPSV